MPERRREMIAMLAPCRASDPPSAYPGKVGTGFPKRICATLRSSKDGNFPRSEAEVVHRPCRKTDAAYELSPPERPEKPTLDSVSLCRNGGAGCFELAFGFLAVQPPDLRNADITLKQMLAPVHATRNALKRNPILLEHVRAALRALRLVEEAPDVPLPAGHLLHPI